MSSIYDLRLDSVKKGMPLPGSGKTWEPSAPSDRIKPGGKGPNPFGKKASRKMKKVRDYA